MNKKIYTLFGKRLFDLLVCLITGLALLPISIIIALAIKLESNGAALYRQERVGKDGKPFEMYKFRSMLNLEDSFDENGNPLENYARITKVGKILRATSVDELPQLLNVFKGEMSLIGPRPTLKYQVERYDASQKVRLNVKPGLTGLAQVNGRNSLTWDQKIDFDVRYVNELSFAMDLKILFKTFGVVFKQESVAFERHDSLSEHDEDFRKDI